MNKLIGLTLLCLFSLSLVAGTFQKPSKHHGHRQHHHQRHHQDSSPEEPTHAPHTHKPRHTKKPPTHEKTFCGDSRLIGKFKHIVKSYAEYTSKNPLLSVTSDAKKLLETYETARKENGLPKAQNVTQLFTLLVTSMDSDYQFCLKVANGHEKPTNVIIAKLRVFSKAVTVAGKEYIEASKIVDEIINGKSVQETYEKLSKQVLKVANTYDYILNDCKSKWNNFCGKDASKEANDQLDDFRDLVKKYIDLLPKPGLPSTDEAKKLLAKYNETRKQLHLPEVDDVFMLFQLIPNKAKFDYDLCDDVLRGDEKPTKEKILTTEFFGDSFDVIGDELIANLRDDKKVEKIVPKLTALFLKISHVFDYIYNFGPACSITKKHKKDSSCSKETKTHFKVKTEFEPTTTTLYKRKTINRTIKKTKHVDNWQTIHKERKVTVTETETQKEVTTKTVYKSKHGSGSHKRWSSENKDYKKKGSHWRKSHEKKYSHEKVIVYHSNENKSNGDKIIVIKKSSWEVKKHKKNSSHKKDDNHHHHYEESY